MQLSLDGIRLSRSFDSLQALELSDDLEHLIVKDDQAVVELHSLATAKNGLKFDNRYCWVCRFANDTIVEVRAYLDSALVARLFAENPI